jgi:hypothetical protein
MLGKGHLMWYPLARSRPASGTELLCFEPCTTAIQADRYQPLLPRSGTDQSGLSGAATLNCQPSLLHPRP